MHSTPVEGERDRAERLQDDWLDSRLVAACHTDAPVLLIGTAESAESVAREIHESSGWRDGPFVVVDCSMGERDVDALLSRLFSQDVTPDELGGTTAERSQDGVVLFREMGKLSPSARAKLARWMAQLRPSGKSGPRQRVMASSMDPLGVDAVFDDPLRRVDVVHIQVDGRKQV